MIKSDGKIQIIYNGKLEKKTMLVWNGTYGRIIVQINIRYFPSIFHSLDVKLILSIDKYIKVLSVHWWQLIKRTSKLLKFQRFLSPNEPIPRPKSSEDSMIEQTNKRQQFQC